MLRLLKRNPLLNKIKIKQTQFPSLPPNLVLNGNLANHQIDLYSFPVFYFSSATSDLRQEFPKIKDSTFDFFHSYGFTDPQIKRLVGSIRIRSPEAMKPKLEHLLTFGFSPSDLVRIICYNPSILATSLNERMKPNLKFLEATLGSKTHIIKSIIRGPWLLTKNLENLLIPNLKILRDNDIPMDIITRMFTWEPSILVKKPNVIIEAIGKLKGLGMRPSTVAFILGMRAMTELKKETWERKMEIYRSLGWSETDTLLAFSRQPNCMTISDDKIKKKMNFFIEKLRWDSSMVLRWPNVLTYSLEGRIIPRCAVLNVLAKNGLWNGTPNLAICNMSEKKFEERFVEKYRKEVPQVIDAYQGKIDFLGFEIKD